MGQVRGVAQHFELFQQWLPIRWIGLTKIKSDLVVIEAWSVDLYVCSACLHVRISFRNRRYIRCPPPSAATFGFVLCSWAGLGGYRYRFCVEPRNTYLEFVFFIVLDELFPSALEKHLPCESRSFVTFGYQFSFNWRWSRKSIDGDFARALDIRRETICH